MCWGGAVVAVFLGVLSCGWGKRTHMVVGGAHPYSFRLTKVESDGMSNVNSFPGRATRELYFAKTGFEEERRFIAWGPVLEARVTPASARKERERVRVSRSG